MHHAKLNFHVYFDMSVVLKPHRFSSSWPNWKSRYVCHFQTKIERKPLTKHYKNDNLHLFWMHLLSFKFWIDFTFLLRQQLSLQNNFQKIWKNIFSFSLPRTFPVTVWDPHKHQQENEKSKNETRDNINNCRSEGDWHGTQTRHHSSLFLRIKVRMVLL